MMVQQNQISSRSFYEKFIRRGDEWLDLLEEDRVLISEYGVPGSTICMIDVLRTQQAYDGP
jgi:hypothetical protein